jgi:putative membrane protein
MQSAIDAFLAGFPVLMLHSSVTIAMLVAGVLIYMRITPWDEVKLIKAGNIAAAISFGGAIIGLALPLAFAMAASVSIHEILLWGPVTLFLQIIAYRLSDLILRGLPTRIENGETASAIMLVAIKLCVAMINAAAVSG